MEILIAAVVGVLVGAVLAWLVARVLFAGRSAALSTERDLLRERVIDLEDAVSDDAHRCDDACMLVDNNHVADVMIAHQLSELQRAGFTSASDDRTCTDFPDVHVNLLRRIQPAHVGCGQPLARVHGYSKRHAPLGWARGKLERARRTSARR